jgi:MYXO-CTERM domain-containing protein
MLRPRHLPAMSLPHAAPAAVALAALLSAAPPRSALANGRFPSAGHVEVDPADPARVIVRATYGLLVTTDAGEHWEWVCEEALGFAGVWDPPIGIAAEGAILAGLPDGLSVSQLGGCAWNREEALAGRLVVDLAVDRTNAARAVVLAASPSSGGFDNALFLTEDGGASFEALPASLPGTLRALTVDLAPSDPATMYVSGVLEGAAPGGIVLRSLDGGSSFMPLPVPGSDAEHGPYIGAVDPVDAARLYVRLEGAPGRLLFSADGGGTWEEIFKGEGPLLGFALAPDGSKLVVGGEKDGVWRSPAPAWAFEQVSPLHVRCLRWAPAGIYACAEPVVDGFAVGLSTTEGSTFVPLERTVDLCGPLECAGGSSVSVSCKPRWPALRETLGAQSCAAPPPPPPNDTPPQHPGGCACRAASEGQGSAAALLALGLVASLRRGFVLLARSGRVRRRGRRA